MQETEIEGIVENILFILPLIHKKFLKTGSPAADSNISRAHLAIMAVVDEAGPVAISEVGRQLLIPKPQMTAFVDRLVRMGMVLRLPDREDRRITRITLTDKGRETMITKKELLRSSVREKLSRLDDKGLESLSASLSGMKNVLAKID